MYFCRKSQPLIRLLLNDGSETGNNSWRIYPYSTGWFYLSRQFPGHNYVEVGSGTGAGVFIGEYFTWHVYCIGITLKQDDNSLITDITKQVKLPAPTEPILTTFGDGDITTILSEFRFSL